jgi:recombination DNA repair RAD52 pathway protein
MVKMAIDKSKWKERYMRNTAAATGDLVDGYVTRTDKVDRMASDDAQKNYEDAMRDKAVLERRQKRLKTLSESDLNEAMRTKGAARYAEGTAASADKALERVGPYLDEIDKITSKLKPRTRDPRQNVMERVVPIAVGLSDLKKKTP